MLIREAVGGKKRSGDLGRGYGYGVGGTVRGYGIWGRR